FSRAIVHDLLRDRLGFQGIAITDALEMKGAAEGREPLEAARLALEAGCDLLLYAFHDESVRRLRLSLADALVDGTIDRANFDAARPRLAAFDGAHPEPSPEDLARPLESLTPPDWEARLERIIERGLAVRGGLPASAGAGGWRVTEPAFPHGPTLASELAGLGVPVDAGATPALDVVAIMMRAPLPAAEVEGLRASAR